MHHNLFHSPLQTDLEDTARLFVFLYDACMPIERAHLEKAFREPYTEYAYRIVDRLVDAGYDTWWVGGCVRDLLLNEQPKDIDIATAATPSEIVSVFPNGKTVNDALGSVRIRQGNFLYEITTFRKESDKASKRKPDSVSFGDRKEDAARRDFTVNALYFHPVSRELFDPFGGEADLREALIRFIGDPATRIQSDPLRILRAVRFRTILQGQYHPDTFQALHVHAHRIRELSGARHLQELEKLLLVPGCDRGFEDLWELDVFEHSVPELYACKGVPQPADYHHEGDVWDHTMRCLRSFQEGHLLDVRIAALFHDIGKTETFSLKERIRFDEHASVSADLASAILKRMHMPRRRIDKIDWLVRHHMVMDPLLEMNDERKAHWYHHAWFGELLQLFWIDIAGTDPADFSLYDNILRDYNRFLDRNPLPIRPLLTGKDVMEITGLRPGARIGELLEDVREAQMKGGVTTKKEAESLLRQLVDS